jgi:hypothetical protein
MANRQPKRNERFRGKIAGRFRPHFLENNLLPAKEIKTIFDD